MRVPRLLVFRLVVIIFGRFSAASHCDQSTTAMVEEGNLGQTPDFNWLGVLRVHLHDGDNLQIAVSGIVLIKDKYALANADDVARIPQRIFQSDTQAMFILSGDTPFFFPPVSYVTHPEYEYTTHNSIAVIELNVENTVDVMLNPICFPSGNFNTSRYLYLTGYTDENQLLEKVIYKIQYLEKNVCEEFYDRAGLSDQKRVPTSYLCGYSPYNGTHCVWDNGMALVSNATGWFTLIGFGVRGPGCAAPARFIDISPYYGWIQSVTGEQDEIYDYNDDYRRRKDGIQFIPTHELFKWNESRRQGQLKDKLGDHFYITYPFNSEKPRHFKIEPVDQDYIDIYYVDEIAELYDEACTMPKVLMYRENFEIKARKGVRGSVTYKLSFYDLYHKICVCVRLKVQCEYREEAVLSFKEEIDFNLATQLTESGETPEEVFKFYPITERTLPPPVDKEEKWKPPPFMKPSFIKDDTRKGRVLNYDLYIKYEFDVYAVLTFDLYAAPEPPEMPAPPEDSKENDDNPKKPNTILRHWGMAEPVSKKAKKPKVKEPETELRVPIDRKIKESEVTLDTEHEVVQKTISVGRRIEPDRDKVWVLSLLASLEGVLFWLRSL